MIARPSALRATTPRPITPPSVCGMRVVAHEWVGIGQATRSAYFWRAASPVVPTRVPMADQDMPD